MENKKDRDLFEDSKVTHVGGQKVERGWSGEVTHVGNQEVKRDGCFITTACAMAMRLPDDCEELTILRKFRKVHLEGTPLGNTILQEYKAISQKILDWIERQDNRISLYADLYQRLVCGSIALIKDGKVDEAINHYKTIVKEYEEKVAIQRD